MTLLPRNDEEICGEAKIRNSQARRSPKRTATLRALPLGKRWVVAALGSVSSVLLQMRHSGATNATGEQSL